MSRHDDAASTVDGDELLSYRPREELACSHISVQSAQYSDTDTSAYKDQGRIFIHDQTSDCNRSD